jgi:peroxiredoxin
MRFSNLIGKDGLIVLLALFLFWALFQNRSLKNQINKRQEPPDLLKAGDVIPFFSGTDIYGNWVDVNNQTLKEKIALTIFRPNCPYCEKMAPFWNEIHDAITNREYTMIGITTGSDSLTQEFAEKHELNFPILSTKLSPTGDSLKKQYKMNVVPLLVIVTADGLIKEVLPGYLDEDRQTQLISNLLTFEHF